ncbi:mRNA-binding ribosome biosynthesis protein NOP4 [Sporobolomyces koalae]|uniref:mRNA-binding ribosome biosynthesis protein NOP4 n=1 Tax=Sporobolomyces koalae TaxID=500713 RepID=UPI003176A310
MPGAKRYFDADSAAGGDSPAKHFKSDRGGGRGRGRGGSRGGSFGGGDRGRGGRGGGGRGSGRGRGGREWEERPKKEPFKPKSGFIAEGLKAYADAAENAKVQPVASTSTDANSPQTTLYLTNLPPNLTSPQLTLIFSSYAPIRAAFVVSTGGASSAPTPDFGGSSANAISVKAGRDRTGKSTSRGFGYVRFVLRTDAEGCLQEWGSQGIPRSAMRDIEGQAEMQNVDWNAICGKGAVKLSWAKKKLREGEAPEGAEKDWKKKKEKKKEEEPVEAAATEEAAAEEQPQKKWRPGLWDYNAPRTVIVQGLPLPGEEGSMEETADDGEAKPETEDDKMDTEAPAAAEGEVEGEGAATGANATAAPHKSKPVDWSKALKQRAKKIGDVEDVKFPVELASGEQVALVTMYTPRHAHDLMTKLNNHVFRGVLVSSSVKSTWDLCQRLGRAKGGGRLVVRNLGFDVAIADLRAAFARFGSLHSITLPVDSNTGKPRGFAFIYYITKSCAEAALKAVNGTRVYAGMAADRIASEGGKEGKKKEVRERKKAEKEAAKGGGGDKGRLVAVDWALGKEDWKKAQEGDVEKVEGESGSEAESSGDDDSEEDSDEEDEEDEDSDMTPEPVGAEDSDMSPEPEDHPDDDDDELEEEPKPSNEGTTLFVRNISFETTEAELYDLFKQFGKVRYARIVYDPTTKRSRGTAFVCMWNFDEAQQVLRESETLNAGLGGETSNKKSTTSLLMADPSTSGASRLTLHGRVIAAVAAVSKNDADKLREDRDKKGNTKTDRRNLYLMREGVIFPSWAIAKTLSAADMDARQSSFDARKGLLRSNPSLYISRTRLSVRQIPLYVTDGMMKRLANHALKQFQIDMKAGLQKPFTEEELAFVEDASGMKEPEKVERKKGVPLSRVRQAKILRQSDRVDPLTGLGRSKGYGFLELGTHADALRVLRWANANKDVNRLFRVWWREALEKMIDQVEKGEGKVGKEVKVKEKEERLKRLNEKMAELEEEEKLAEEKASKREAAGKAATGEQGRSSKCLIIEFSIENAVTTKRRAEKADRAREKAKRAKERGGEESEDSGSDDDEADKKSQKSKKDVEDDGDEEDKPAKEKKSKVGSKKRKAAAAERGPVEKKTKKEPGVDAEGNPKEGSRIGSMIGRKRRAKAGKR